MVIEIMSPCHSFITVLPAMYLTRKIFSQVVNNKNKEK